MSLSYKEMNINYECSIKSLSSSNRFYYEVTVLNQSTVELRCFLNFHQLSGNNFRHCLPNGRWSGEEPVCEVDYYKERFRLSLFITLVTMFIVICFLMVDFSRHLYRRVRVKENKRVSQSFYLKRRYQHFLAPRRLANYSVAVRDLCMLDERLEIFKSVSAATFAVDFGANSFKANQVTPRYARADSTSSPSTNTNFQRGMFLFRMKNKPFSMQDPTYDDQ
ncbi:uncharacterized protein LOC129922584 isoform X1 [Biomphalaria glabrata]|uniref:Uncharacterized protein LOC129922584 isoform X1 n=1 Tax=Biomphalaria glabrata TaxID=6526 RepID=A0A9W2YRA1_BIOGL|nr:uncharacterized protein LOC129922584 isoform X1 [Biomphalaria glabrata]XP_055865235.1 uncharacterized protein LOC129922584 isoform X1 [Biomphalaria glabrata]XP_055865236.1 uncharacterized protein LOC129922584 isoform X1 [Biomphalaria glabrata]